MSAYMTAQGLLKTLLLTNSSFGASDVTEGDLRILDSGSTNTAVLFPGSVPTYDVAGMERQHEWTAILDLFKRFVDDTSYSGFGTLRDSVFTTIEAAPALSASFFIYNITSDSEPFEVFDKQGAGPFFIGQRFLLSIMEQV